MAVAALGVYLAYTGAADGPTDRVVVARHGIRIGEVIEPDDLRVADATMPARGDGYFDDVGAVVGRVALGPIGAGELVQAASVTADRSDVAGHEIALTLPREQVAVGRLRQGERVDVFVTLDDRTTSVVRGARVVQIDAGGEGSLTSEREVSIVVATESAEAVAGLVHALRTGDVTVVRSTFATEDTTPIEAGGDVGGGERTLPDE
jgi:Flp pilus assembly protein CpaB